MNKQRILILYNSIGLGHKSIAENIGYYLEKIGYDVKLEDILQVQGNWLSDAAAWLYHIFLLWLPFVWSFLYLNKTLTNFLLKFRTKLGGKNYHHVKQLIDEFKPELIISTHTVSSGIVDFLKTTGLYKGQFAIAFSDFHLHRFWVYPAANFYLVNIEEQKQEMVNLGVKPENIIVCGITLKPQGQVNAGEVKNRLGINPKHKVALVSSGSQGTEINKSLLDFLVNQPNIKTIVVCGKNTKLFERLNLEFQGTNIIPVGFYKPMDELYAISNIYITKPGGLSTAEALRWNLPMLISHLLPGQEELNFKYLVSKKLVMSWPLNIKQDALQELENGEFHEQLKQNGQKQALFPDENILVQGVEKLIKP